MNGKEILIERLKANSFHKIYTTIHEMEMRQFEEVVREKGTDIVNVSEEYIPSVTVTCHDEPIDVLVKRVIVRDYGVFVIGDNYGTENEYALGDIEKGHLECLADYLI